MVAKMQLFAIPQLAKAGIGTLGNTLLKLTRQFFVHPCVKLLKKPHLVCSWAKRQQAAFLIPRGVSEIKDTESARNGNGEQQRKRKRGALMQLGLELIL